MQDAYAAPSALPVSHIGADARGRFIAKTYAHLLAAVFAFVALEALFYVTGIMSTLAVALSSVPWMLVLGAFMVSGWLASRMAESASSSAVQYLGLALMVVAYAVIFTLPLAIGAQIPGLIQNAALVTLAAFSGLTWFVFITRKDFAWMRALLVWIGIGALVMIGAGLLFGFELGLFFSVGMVIFAGASILYDTSNVLHHYPEDRYVAASLQLFASVALMFWYILRLFMSFSDD